MSKAIQILNLLLAIALAVLCSFQWTRERSANEKIRRLEKKVSDQAVEIKSDTQTIKELTEDNTAFKAQITSLEAANKEQESTLKMNATEISKLTSENEGLKTSLEAWKKGVAERDERLKTQNEMLKKLGEQREDLANRLKEAVLKHNEVVKELNAIRSPGTTQAPTNSPAPPKK